MDSQGNDQWNSAIVIDIVRVDDDYNQVRSPQPHQMVLSKSRNLHRRKICDYIVLFAIVQRNRKLFAVIAHEDNVNEFDLVLNYT